MCMFFKAKMLSFRIPCLSVYGRGAATRLFHIPRIRSGAYPCTHTIFTLTGAAVENTCRMCRYY